MLARKLFLTTFYLGCSSSLVFADGSFVATNPNHVFLAASGVGAAVSSNRITQHYGALPPGSFIPNIAKLNLNYGTGGAQVAGGYEHQVNEFWSLQSSLQYLYLARQNQRVMPFYQTMAYESAFFTNVEVQSLMFNVGVSRNLVERIALYADGGVGAAFLSIFSSYMTNSAVLALVQPHNTNPTNFSWQAGGGVRYNMTEHSRFDAGVHYASFGNVNFGSFAQTPSLPDGVRFSANHFAAVLFSFGINYTLS